MNDYMTFKTRTEAKKVMATMAGWPELKIEWLYLPKDPNANKQGNVAVIYCGNGRYLRSDGYVR
jgi:hypothetical protein